MKKLKIIFVILCLIILLHIIWYFYHIARGPIQKRYDFSKVTSVAVYDIDPREFPQTTNLEHINNIEFNLVLFKELVAKAKYEAPFFLLDATWWKGGSLAIVKFSDNTELRLAFSYYGSYFEVIGELGTYYFETSKDENSDFQRWRNEYNGRIIHGYFHRLRENAKENK